jgi:hypothetical protein
LLLYNEVVEPKNKEGIAQQQAGNVEFNGFALNELNLLIKIGLGKVKVNAVY